MSEIINIGAVFIITAVTYFFTNQQATKPLLFQFFVFYSFFTVGAFGYYLYSKQNKIKSLANTVFVYILSVTIFILLGMSGWFFSPFVYLLYLLAFFYAFIFSPRVTISFSTILFILYLNQVNYQIIWSDFIALFSILLIVPSSYYLRKQFLTASENSKKILILEEGQTSHADKADEFLANKVTKFAVELREHAADIRQVSLFLEGKEDDSNKSQRIKQIGDLSELILNKIEQFETAVTGRKLVHTKKN